jgi:hypothetical protein
MWTGTAVNLSLKKFGFFDMCKTWGRIRMRDRHRFDVVTDPDRYQNGNSDPDWHQNNAEP